MARINDWPGLCACQRLRQWPYALRLADAAAISPFVGLVLLGSFARGEADDLSDVDFIVFSGEDGFEAAWKRRHHLYPEGAWCWDYPRPPRDREVAGQAFIGPTLNPCSPR